MYDTGSTAFMIVYTMLVALMTPGLSFFYGGLSRRKNVMNTMMMAMAAIGIVGIMWVVCGWSFAYGGDGSAPFRLSFVCVKSKHWAGDIKAKAPE